MRGIQHVEVSNRDAKYKFDLHRNITIVGGKSGTGKTTLFDMIADYTRTADRSGVTLSSTKRCVALIDIDWKNQLSNTHDSIVFIDEGFEDIRTKEFAEIVKNTDNYYLIFSRDPLHELPYSAEEIYEIKHSGKYHTFQKLYKSSNHIYYIDKKPSNKKFNVLLTEDSKSGFQFYENFFKDKKIEVCTSNSNSNIFKWLKENKEKTIFVVADGAAFGSEIDRVLKLKPAVDFELCLPESFEWLILKSNLIEDDELNGLLEYPEAYIESAENFSWEVFFTKYLVQITHGKHYAYSKSELSSFYKVEKNANKIISEIYK